MTSNSNAADISALETLQGTANAQMGAGSMSVFNAKFTEVKKLTPEQEKEAQKHKDAIIAAEKKFRQEDDRVRQIIKMEEKKLDDLKSKRIAAYTAFDAGMSKLEEPLKKMGVTVQWDEPKVDRTHLDAFG